MAALAAGVLLCAAAPAAGRAEDFPVEGAQGMPSVTVAVLSSTDDLESLTHVRGLALGLLSGGIGDASSEQMLLDITQGNRVNSHLYDDSLPSLGPFGTQVPSWTAIVDRADDAPADLVPGLLASSLRSAGIPVRADPHPTDSALLAADQDGRVERLARPGCSYRRRCPGLVVIPATRHKLVGLAMGVRSGDQGVDGSDLLIAITEPDPDGVSAIGIAAPTYFDELREDRTRALTSDSTRTPGIVLSTDVAPTILRRFGLATPGAMDGEPIRPGSITTLTHVLHRATRLEEIQDRRASVVISCLLAWLVVAVAIVVRRPGLRRDAAAWLALAFAYMPAMLLAGAAVRPNAFAEGMLVGVGAAALAALTVRFVKGWRGLAIACAITVSAYAIDVIAGSGLTRLSLLGPDPIFGVRFYGIGNELEALFAVMVPVGVAAGLSAYTGWGRGVSRGGAIAAFVVAGAIGAAVFGAGAFGADVGAAIVLPVGAVVASAALPTSGPIGAKSRQSLLVALALTPLVALGVLALIDLVTGAHSHLSRSVLDAGGASDLADVAQRRLELSAHDFAQAAANPLFWIVVVGIGVAIGQWRRIDSWLTPAPIARAGLIGACAAVAVGVLVNDSGATFLVLGSLALGAFLAYAWSQAGEIGSSPRNPRVDRG